MFVIHIYLVGASVIILLGLYAKKCLRENCNGTETIPAQKMSIFKSQNHRTGQDGRDMLQQGNVYKHSVPLQNEIKVFII